MFGHDTQYIVPAFPEVVPLLFDLGKDSLWAQLRRINRCLDEAQKEVYKTNEDHRDSMTRGSPFTQVIQDKPILLNFCLPMLEAYNNGADPAKHFIAFQAQMALYDTSDVLMCGAFPTTL